MNSNFYHKDINGIQYINGNIVLQNEDISTTTNVEVGTLVSDSQGNAYIFTSSNKWAVISTSTVG